MFLKYKISFSKKIFLLSYVRNMKNIVCKTFEKYKIVILKRFLTALKLIKQFLQNSLIDFLRYVQLFASEG